MTRKQNLYFLEINPQLLKTITKAINVCGDSIDLQEVVRYLGAWLDKFPKL